MATNKNTLSILDMNVVKSAFSSKETFLVETGADAPLLYKDGTVAVDGNTTATVDIVYKKGKLIACYVRDEEAGHDLKVGSLHVPGWFRRLCESRCAATKYVAGGCQPICPAGFTCVDNYNMSGTTYFLVPDYVVEEFMRDNAEFSANSYWH